MTTTISVARTTADGRDTSGWVTLCAVMEPPARSCTSTDGTRIADWVLGDALPLPFGHRPGPVRMAAGRRP